MAQFVVLVQILDGIFWKGFVSFLHLAFNEREMFKTFFFSFFFFTLYI